MIRLKKTIKNLIILAIMLPLFMGFNGLFFSPTKALHTSEKDLHYGPTEIVHSFERDNMRYFLGRYENYITFVPIKRAMGIFWRYGGGFGVENHSDKPVFYSYRSNDDEYAIFGVRNDHDIVRIDLVFKGPDEYTKRISIDEFYDDLFYVMWKKEDDTAVVYGLSENCLFAYDKDEKIVYETLF
ncbi:MAG TPA: hypothetical protein VFC96_07940 [Anaerovoracaceae bacterium]|nr:hypothetical protein [Anaerovoracaceae bacterium]